MIKDILNTQLDQDRLFPAPLNNGSMLTSYDFGISLHGDFNTRLGIWRSSGLYKHNKKTKTFIFQDQKYWNMIKS